MALKKIKCNTLRIPHDFLNDDNLTEWLYDRFDMYWRFEQNQQGTFLQVSIDYDLTEFKLTWL